MSIKLSILVVSYNTKEYTRACIESFVNIGRADCELFVLDNHSKDGTQEYLKNIQEQNVYVILNDSNIGFAKGMNICYQRTKGEYVMTFNPDAILYNETLDQLIHFLDQNKDVGLVALANKSHEGIVEYPEVDFRLIHKIETLKWKLPRINKLEGKPPLLQWIWGTGITIRKQNLGPDNYIFPYLEFNKNSQGLNNVKLINKAVWNSETNLNFSSDLGMGGQISNNLIFDSNNIVETVRLRDFIDSEIDMLKIDIEGAEYIVLKDIEDKLNLVNNLFIEYHDKQNDIQRLDDILSILNNNNFRYHIVSGFSRKSPFVDKNLLSDMFEMTLNIFAYK